MQFASCSRCTNCCCSPIGRSRTYHQTGSNSDTGMGPITQPMSGTAYLQQLDLQRASLISNVVDCGCLPNRFASLSSRTSLPNLSRPFWRNSSHALPTMYIDPSQADPAPVSFWQKRSSPEIFEQPTGKAFESASKRRRLTLLCDRCPGIMYGSKWACIPLMTGSDHFEIRYASQSRTCVAWAPGRAGGQKWSLTQIPYVCLS